jgi:hypothetical protein
MDEATINQMLDQLKNKQIKEFFVAKEDFLSVRKVLVNRSDFKHFRGTALRGGNVVYEYLDQPRS